MLYISEVVGVNKYAVTDTDDGVTEVASYRDLYKCAKKGIEIKGVTVNEGGVLNITVVSLQSTRDLAKLAFIKGVDIRVNDGVLGYFALIKPLTANLEIVFSRYCHEIAGYAIHPENMNESASNGYKLTFVFDDNVSFSKKSFRDVRYSRGVIYDVSRVKEFKDAMKIYKLHKEHDISVLLDNGVIIDNRERFVKLFGLTLMEVSVYSGISRDKLLASFSPDEIEEMQKIILRKYKKSFLEYRDTKCIIDKDKMFSRGGSSFLRETYSGNDYYSLALFMVRFTKYASGGITALYNFYRYFRCGDDAEVKDSLDALMENTIRALNDFRMLNGYTRK